ncbi:MAG: riboflavin synthase [Proteobacteria bacterium]|nr:riboflavin synthase [Pseudomonadota bacterium]
MFTGIIEATGKLTSLSQKESEWRLTISAGKLDMSDVKLGDSIAVNGCCLTVVDRGDNHLSADVSLETLRCTTLGSLQQDSRLNLEKAMLASSRFGGHIVSGHVDGVGELVASQQEGKSIRLDFSIPDELAKYIAAKGSICIDGASMTVNEVSGSTFSINVIPHTQEETIIGEYKLGQRVNIEVDLVARYLERLVLNKESADTTSPGIDLEFLKQHGFQSA